MLQENVTQLRFSVRTLVFCRCEWEWCFNSDLMILSGVSGAGGAQTVTSPDYGVDNPNSRRGKTFISSPKRPDQL